MSGALSSPAKPPPWRCMPARRRRLGFPPSASGLFFPDEVPSARRGAAASEEIRPCIACCGAIRRRPGFPKNGPTSFSRRRRRSTSASQGWCANIRLLLGRLDHRRGLSVALEGGRGRVLQPGMGRGREKPLGRDAGKERVVRSAGGGERRGTRHHREGACHGGGGVATAPSRCGPAQLGFWAGGASLVGSSLIVWS